MLKPKEKKFREQKFEVWGDEVIEENVIDDIEQFEKNLNEVDNRPKKNFLYKKKRIT